LRRIALRSLLGLTACFASSAFAAPVVWSGHWVGVAHDTGPHYRIERPIDLAITEGRGGLTVVDHDRMRGNVAPAALHVEGHRAWATYQGLWPTPIRIDATLSANGHDLTLRMTGDGMTGLESHEATLHKDDPAFARYLHPRVDSTGAPVRQYVYREPKNSDGLPVSTPEAEGMARAPLEALVRAILSETGDRETHQTESLLVLRHGKLVLEEYFWGQDPVNPHIISSATKSVTSIIAGIAYDREQLALDKPIADYFADKNQTLWVRNHYPITVRDILAMSSGTKFDEIPGGPNSFGLLSTRDVTSFVMDVPAAYRAGTVFNYDNGLPSLMEPLLTRVTGTPYADLADKGLFRPLAIDNYRWTYLPEGIPLSAGGLYLRSRDMAKIGQMMLDHGLWRGKRIVSDDWIAQSTRQQTAPGQYPYGFYWHLNNDAKRRVANWDGYFAIGQGGQIIGIFPKQDVVVVMTSADWATSKTNESSDVPFELISRFIVPSIEDERPSAKTRP
jgi:CubicO group peptidase (beta-lactamase class C family)